jgi:large subunit ribosomal protein L15
MRGFEGGQMPLQRRVPKRGFFNKFAKRVGVVTTGQLNRFDADSTVDQKALEAAGLVPKRCEIIRVILKGDVEKALKVETHKISKGAAAAITEKGGSVKTP